MKLRTPREHGSVIRLPFANAIDAVVTFHAATATAALQRLLFTIQTIKSDGKNRNLLFIWEGFSFILVAFYVSFMCAHCTECVLAKMKTLYGTIKLPNSRSYMCHCGSMFLQLLFFFHLILIFSFFFLFRLFLSAIARTSQC